MGKIHQFKTCKRAHQEQNKCVNQRSQGRTFRIKVAMAYGKKLRQRSTVQGVGLSPATPTSSCPQQMIRVRSTETWGIVSPKGTNTNTYRIPLLVLVFRSMVTSAMVQMHFGRLFSASHDDFGFETASSWRSRGKGHLLVRRPFS